jgi:hypothetical protein
VKWKCFEKTVVGVNKVTGEPRKRIHEVYKQIPSAEFVTYLKPKLQKFIKHSIVVGLPVPLSSGDIAKGHYTLQCGLH